MEKSIEDIKFSVLMSVYYKENPDHLRLALDSIIDQTLLPNEIILVEDGVLTDELYKVIDDYCKKYSFLKIIKLKKNVGLGNALNEGLKHCSYEYVARMDTDDISLKNRFEKQISYLRENPNVDVVGGNIIEFDSDSGKIISAKIVPEKYRDILKYSKKRNPLNHMTVIFKKSSVLSAGGYKDCLYFEDYFLWVRMLKNGNQIYNIQETLVKVRSGIQLIKRRGSLSYIRYIINFQNKMLRIKKMRMIQLYCWKNSKKSKE